MLYNAAVLLVCIWVVIYEVSYAMFEYKKGNKAAAAAIFLLCLAISTLTVVFVIF